MKGDIFQLEENLRVAMERSDIAALDTLIDEELIFTTHAGQVISKADDLAIHQSGLLRFESIQLSEQHVRWLTDVAVVSVTADIRATFQGERADGVFKFTRVWAKRAEGEYQVIAGHACAKAT